MNIRKTKRRKDDKKFKKIKFNGKDEDSEQHKQTSQATMNFK